ncbi:MAG: bifunctional adenosylcobinamide kinase/adenosylcobinamide-phosphate guanylyltransferase [Stomatobaculum sp.]
MILIIGGSASGKSAYAERRLAALSGPKIYLATMESRDTESGARIRRHRALRAERNFRTIECPRSLWRAEIGAEDNVLLECLSNLAANEMFPPDGAVREAEETAALLADEVTELAKRCRRLIVVGNLLTEAGTDYAGMTGLWLRAFSDAQNRLAREAEEVWRVTLGLPERIK